MPDSSDLVIADFLEAEGFTTPEAQGLARGVLEALGLTRAGKTRIAASKREAARAAITSRLALACSGCQSRAEAAAGQRRVVEVPAEACPFCHGSVNRRAMAELVQVCAERKVQRILVVGGTPVLHHTLEQLAQATDAAVTFRFVEATERVRTKGEAGTHLKWADVAVIWAPSPLPHKVSNLYTEHPEARRARLVTCHQRGIAALCAAIARGL